MIPIWLARINRGRSYDLLSDDGSLNMGKFCGLVTRKPYNILGQFWVWVDNSWQGMYRQSFEEI